MAGNKLLHFLHHAEKNCRTVASWCNEKYKRKISHSSSERERERVFERVVSFTTFLPFLLHIATAACLYYTYMYIHVELIIIKREKAMLVSLKFHMQAMWICGMKCVEYYCEFACKIKPRGKSEKRGRKT